MRAGAADEGLWLRAERQTAGRGRQGRSWVSPVGNFYGSTVVRLRPGDPAAATLGFVAAVALEEVVAAFLRHPRASGDPAPFSHDADQLREMGPRVRGNDGLVLKWPNDLLIGGAKVSGILLERADDAVVIGCGVNLAHHPDLPDRPTTSLAAHGAGIEPAAFAGQLAQSFAAWLPRWRDERFAAIRGRWLEHAHPPGTPLRAALPDGSAMEGTFEDLDSGGALILNLPSGERRVIHAGDVFLV